MFNPTVVMTGLSGEKLIHFYSALSVHPAKNEVIAANESFWQLFRIIVSYPHIMDKVQLLI